MLFVIDIWAFCEVIVSVWLDARLDEALFEGRVESCAHCDVGGAADGGVTLRTLQAGDAAEAHVANFTCTAQTFALLHRHTTHRDCLQCYFWDMITYLQKLLSRHALYINIKWHNLQAWYTLWTLWANPIHLQYAVYFCRNSKAWPPYHNLRTTTVGYWFSRKSEKVKLKWFQFIKWPNVLWKSGRKHYVLAPAVSDISPNIMFL